MTSILEGLGSIAIAGFALAFGFFLGAWAIRMTMLRGVDKHRWEVQVNHSKESLQELKIANEHRSDIAGELAFINQRTQHISEYLCDIRELLRTHQQIELSTPNDEGYVGKIEKGDIVLWTAIRGPVNKRKKEGIVQMVIPAGELPREFPEGFNPMHYTAETPRDHESYVVSIKKHLFWPVASSLRLKFPKVS